MKKALYILAIIVGCFTAHRATAQDEGIFHHYLVNPTLFNPAFAGLAGKHQVFAHTRSQWSGFPGAPTTYALTYNGIVADKVGLGAMLLNENLAALNRVRGQLSYAYHYTSKQYQLGLGFSTEFHRSRITEEALLNPYVNRADFLVQDAMQGITYFDASIGAAFVWDNKLTVALSSPNLVRARLGIISTISDTVKRPSTFFRQFILMSSYRFKLENGVTFEPSLLVRKPYLAPLEADFNARVAFLNDQFQAGVTYRPGTSGAVALLAGFRQGGFQINYSYTVSTAQFNTYTRSGHELSLGFEIVKPKETKVKGNPTKTKKKKYTKSKK